VTTMLTGPLLTLFARQPAPVHGLQKPSSP
jgi:hypothetical protein